MPRPVTGIGFFGKLPARGDFVRAGLPRGFVDPWDAWLQRVLPASRAILGEGWEPAWLEAPVWCFALPAGQCGPDAMTGLWMPSVDRIGRYFPLMLARVGCGAATDRAFLAAAEAAGRSAIAEDWAPEQLLTRLKQIAAERNVRTRESALENQTLKQIAAERNVRTREAALENQALKQIAAAGNEPGSARREYDDADVPPGDVARWWTGGSPRRSPWSLGLSVLPDVKTFALMLDQGAGEAVP